MTTGEKEGSAWARRPLSACEQSLAAIADWGPAEDWSGWVEEGGVRPSTEG